MRRDNANGNTILVGAEEIRPNRFKREGEPEWHVWGWQGEPIIMVTENGVVVLDTREQKLYAFSETLRMCEINPLMPVEAHPVATDIVVMTMRPSEEEVVQRITDLDPRAWERVLEIAAAHPPTRDRLLAMRK